MVFNTQLLSEMIEGKYVKVQQHPTADLFIYNYTALAQYERAWNECTLQCRGLILDGAGNIVARPFSKFFNLGEYEGQRIPAEPFNVYEKMDGSLGILYWMKDQPMIATRGSFVSDQSVEATRMLQQLYSDAIPLLDRRFTYLFEIIYPENRIVVDYGQCRQLVLLAVVDHETGEEQPLSEIGFPLVKRYDGLRDIHQLKALETANKEGFVICYQSGYRLKVKFDEYQRIHRILTCVSSISIWEYLKEGKPLDEILERVPDEFYA
ncbi:MAG: T4 RnlA family RNA ligase, partial [Bacteroidota bacterium]